MPDIAPEHAVHQVHQEILAALATAAAPLTSTDLHPHCQGAADRTAISRALYDLRTSGRIAIAGTRLSHSGRGSRQINAYAITDNGRAWLHTSEGLRRATAAPPAATGGEGATADHACQSCGSTTDACAHPGEERPGCRQARPEHQHAVASAAALLAPGGQPAEYAAPPAPPCRPDVSQIPAAAPVDTRPRLTVTRIAIHRTGESPGHDEGVTWVELEDLGAGPYLVIRQTGDRGHDGLVAINPDELPLLVEAARRLGFDPDA